MTIEQKLEAVYVSLHADNKGIDEAIYNLKSSMINNKLSEVEIDSSRLPVPNREGRNMLKSYFKKRGVKVKFKMAESV